MTTNVKPIYKRILLKLSGEALKGSEGFGIDECMLDRLAQEVKELVNLGIQVGIVIGGGNIFRGAGLEKAGMNRIIGDQMGMLATVMNSLAMSDSLRRFHMKTSVMSAIPINGICDDHNWVKAINLLQKSYVVIFATGTGNAFFTTDSAACLRGLEIKADAVLKGTKVDGVFTADPDRNSSAVMYEQLTYTEVLDNKLEVMDLSAFTLARDHELSIRIFNITKPGALLRVVIGEKEGTLVKN